MGEQTLRPVTMKQLANCEITQEGTFRIDNADVTQVCAFIFIFYPFI